VTTGKPARFIEFDGYHVDRLRVGLWTWPGGSEMVSRECRSSRLPITGAISTVYLGGVVDGLLVTWMIVSTQAIQNPYR
jgi:hypothetical protein